MILLLILTVRTINSDKINPLSNKNVLIDDQKLGEHLKNLNIEMSNNLEVQSRHHPNNVIDDTSYEQDVIK